MCSGRICFDAEFQNIMDFLLQHTQLYPNVQTALLDGKDNGCILGIIVYSLR